MIKKKVENRNNSFIKIKIDKYSFIKETNESIFIFCVTIDQQKFIYDFKYPGNPILDCLILNLNDKSIYNVIEQLNFILNSSYFYQNLPEKIENIQNESNLNFSCSTNYLEKFNHLKIWLNLIEKLYININLKKSKLKNKKNICVDFKLVNQI